MLCASLLFSLMSLSVYTLGIRHPELPAMTVSFFRVSTNLFVLLLPAVLLRRLPLLLGDFRTSLWLRGLLGSLALILSFALIQRIGPGEATFLGASSGVFVTLFSPVILAQRDHPWIWPMLLGSLAGLYLLLQPRPETHDGLGRVMALGSGFFSAMAYLMVARAGRSNRPSMVLFYFCLVALPIHLGWFLITGFPFPRGSDTWALLLLCGLAASGAQIFMTRAYHSAPAAMVAVVGYTTPLINLLLYPFGYFRQGSRPKRLVRLQPCVVDGVLSPFLMARSARRW
jgi:S-adenosylmethionine uptake transporter